MVMKQQQDQQQQQPRIRKPSLGRRRVEITKIEKPTNLQVTFSKRRRGLFNKAAELCIHCGAQIGIIVFSPNNKAFTFGHPSIDSIVNSFINNNNDVHNNAIVVDHGYNQYHYHQQQQQQQQQHEVGLLNHLIEVEKKRRQGIEKLIRDRKDQQVNGKLFWWENLNNIDDMGLKELEQVRSSMEEIKRNLSRRIHELEIRSTSFPTTTSSNMSSTILDVNPIGMIDPYSYSGDHHQTASIVPYHETSYEGLDNHLTCQVIDYGSNPNGYMFNHSE